MISNTTIFDAMSRIVRGSGGRVYSDTLQGLVTATGKPYLVYFNKYKDERPAGSPIPDNGLGRLLVTADGQYWASLRHTWVRDDENGRTIQEEYEKVYAEIEARWAHLRRG